MRLDAQIHHLTATQHGCVASWQLREVGAQKTEIARLRRSPRFAPFGRRTLVLVGSPPTIEQQAMAAILEAGPSAALSHRSAAAGWDLGDSYRLLPAHVSRARDLGCVRAPGAGHPISGLTHAWTTVLHDLPIVRPELCVYQLCGTEHPDRAERALDAAWSAGLVTGASLRACLEDMRASGRNGTIVLEELLDLRGATWRPPASGLERRFEQIMRERLIGPFRRQVESGDDRRWVGRVDFAHERHPLIVEVLSERYHAALSYQRDDAERFASLRTAGFEVVEVWDAEVWHQADAVAARVRAALRRATTLAG